MPKGTKKKRQKIKERKTKNKNVEIKDNKTNNNDNNKNKSKKSKKSKKNEIEEEFKIKLKELGYYIKEVEGDGNCLFRSVADQMENNEKLHKKFREKCVEYMIEHKDTFSPFIEDDKTFDEYIKNISKSKEWGGNLEIYAMSMAFKINFYIYIHEHPLYIVKNFDDPIKNVLLTYHDGEHYNSLRKLDDGLYEEELKKSKEKYSSNEEDNQNEDDESEDEERKKSNKEIEILMSKVEHLNI